MARITYNFKETGVDAISLAGRTRLGRVQSSDVGTNLPNTPVQELGSNKLVGRIFDIPEVTVSVSAIDVGPRTPFLLAGKDWATAAEGDFMEAQDIQYVCLAQTFKSEASDDIARTLFIPGAKLESLNMNYSVGGDATEDYSFQATTTHWLRYDVALASGTTAGSGLALGGTARQLKNGKYVLGVFASGIGYVPNEAVVASTATTVTFDTTIVPDGTFVVAMYHTDLSNQWDYTYEYPHVAVDYTPAPDQVVGIRGWGVELYLIKSGQANQRIYRAQNCTIQSQLATTKIQELGSEAIVGYSDGIPEVTGTIEIMQHDFKLHALLSGDDTLDDDNLDPNELGTGNWGLLVKIFRRGVDRAVASPEKTVWIPSIDVTQESNRAQVGQDVSQTFNWASRTGEVYIYKGNKLA
jgi:hypothetical protein